MGSGGYYTPQVYTGEMFVLPRDSSDGVIYDMSKLDKMKEDINHGLPAVGKLIDEVANDLPKKIDSFFNSVSEGFEKFFTH